MSEFLWIVFTAAIWLAMIGLVLAFVGGAMRKAKR